MHLGARLAAVAGFVPRHSAVADIGTDHAYLPIALIQQGIAVRALAMDVHEGPYQAARRAVARANLTEKIEVRLGDGMAVLAPGECDTAVLAGMGGATIADILSKCPATTAQLEHLILQPMNAAPRLRYWLLTHGWRITDEMLAEEDRRLYEILHAEPGAPEVMEPILYEIGPRIWEKRDPLLAAHIGNLIRQARAILSSMASSEAAQATEKFRSMEFKLRCLEEKFACR